MHIALHLPPLYYTHLPIVSLFRSSSSFVSSCGKSSCPACCAASCELRAAASAANKETALTVAANSGIFGYINYLVEKDRKYILDTLVNGT